MHNTFEKQADYIPYVADEYKFYSTLQNLTTTSPDHWSADKMGLETVGTATKIFQTVKAFFGWLGLINYTAIHNVEYGLMKYLYYGYSQGYLRQPAFKEWITGLQKQSFQFSITTRQMLDYLEKTPDYNLNETMRSDLSQFLSAYQAQHHSNIDSIGGSTILPTSANQGFGTSPQTMGYCALARGNHEKALKFALAAYNLRVAANYDDVGDLFLAIVYSTKTPHPILIEKLKEFQKSALDKGNFRHGLQFDEAIHHLCPSVSEEVSPEVLLEYGRIKRLDSQYDSAIAYFTRAEHQGIAAEGIDREWGGIYRFQAEEEEKNGNFIEALRLYELASRRGVELDELRQAELYMQAANASFVIENSRWLGANFTSALHWFDSAIHLYGKNKQFSNVLFQGRWLDHYLVALKHHKELPRGIEMLSRHVDQMIHLFKEERPMLKEERRERIQKIRPFIQKALQILDVMIHHDPNNPEHHFKKAFIYDYLNYAGESSNPLPHYEKAVSLDPYNPYYLMSYLKTCWAQDYSGGEYRDYYINERCRNAEFWYEHERFNRNASRFEAIY